MKITCAPNGPYLLKNVPKVKRASGEAYPAAQGVALCRCGCSKSKPFCDGTHWSAGFKDGA